MWICTKKKSSEALIGINFVYSVSDNFLNPVSKVWKLYQPEHWINRIATTGSTAKPLPKSCPSSSMPIKEKEYKMALACV